MRTFLKVTDRTTSQPVYLNVDMISAIVETAHGTWWDVKIWGMASVTIDAADFESLSKQLSIV